MLTSPVLNKQIRQVHIPDTTSNKIHIFAERTGMYVYIFPKSTLKALEDFRNKVINSGGTEGPYLVNLKFVLRFTTGNTHLDLFNLGVQYGQDLLNEQIDFRVETFTVWVSYSEPTILLAHGKKQSIELGDFEIRVRGEFVGGGANNGEE